MGCYEVWKRKPEEKTGVRREHMASILGIDLGTSSVKAMLLDVEKGVVGVEAQSYDVLIPQANYAQQSPEEWWRGVCVILKRLNEKYPESFLQIEAVGLSGQMHGLVMVDENGQVLHPAIIWLDQRSGRECEKIMEIGRDKDWDAVLQNRIFPGFAFPSLVWMKGHEPDLYQRIDKIMQPKDYIRYCLTGQVGAEVTDASASLMFDVKQRKWADSITEAFGIDSKIFPPCHESMEIAGTTTEWAQAETGLKAGIPVIYGAGDQQCQSIGNGVFKEGQTICNIGTGGQISVFSVLDRYDKLLRTNTFCHCHGNGYTIYGASLCAGMALKWLKNNILQEESFGVLSQSAQMVSPGSDGVLFLPYLAGERTPHMNPEAKGMFFGLQLGHKKEHMIRAVMEGVVYALKDSLDILEEMGITSEQIIASGGASASPVWLQIQADIFNKEIRVCKEKEQACLGACILAGVGTGLFENLEEGCKRFVNYEEQVYVPQPEAVKVYQAGQKKFRELYERNRDLF